MLRCGVFLIDMKEFQQMNAVYARVFGDHRPARTTIQAAGLPGDGLRVEIDCIACTTLATKARATEITKGSIGFHTFVIFVAKPLSCHRSSQP